MKKIVIKLIGFPTVQYSVGALRLSKLSSGITTENFIKLLKYADNKVNPREAKVNKITKHIQETLEYSPELLFFKSKGILIATENCRMLERNRIEMTFDSEEFEGIMDGGHNTLAIASYIVEKLMGEKLKSWEECKAYWASHYEEILEEFHKREEEFAFTVPIEIIFPGTESGSIDDYYEHLKDICFARNNNVQLTEGGKGNQKGYYDYLKEVLGDDFDVVWKPGEKGKIRLEDVIALASIPLLYLANNKMLPEEVKPISKISVYANKGKCVDFFNEIMGHPKVSEIEKGRHIIKDPLVMSALELTKDILPFFDWLYLNFPKLYNKNAGAFGKITSVVDKESKVPFSTTDKKCSVEYPFGFLYPIVCGLTSLMEYDAANERLNWRVSPSDIAADELDMAQYVNIVKLVGYDPQKVGKNETFYIQAEEIFKKF
jgi:hypothetical protein